MRDRENRSSSKKKIFLYLLLLILLLFIIALFSLSKGSVFISNKDILLAILKKGDQINQTIIWELRLPRFIASLLVGSSLGMSGALLQGMLKNGLASPYLLGISAGSGLVIVFFYYFWFSTKFHPFCCMVGSNINYIICLRFI